MTTPSPDQRLAVDGLERFEGNGVYYAATDLEARVCAGSDVIVVGGGNSAGQEPLPFETSLPGVFAVGDVRRGSMKRGAAAVGEGSSAVRSVHDSLALTG